MENTTELPAGGGISAWLGNNLPFSVESFFLKQLYVDAMEQVHIHGGAAMRTIAVAFVFWVSRRPRDPLPLTIHSSV